MALLPSALHSFAFSFLNECLFSGRSPVLNIHILFPQKGLKNVFDEAILAALEPPEPKKRRKCVLL